MIKKIIAVAIMVALVAGVFVLNGLRQEDGESVLHVADETPLPVVAARPKRQEMVRIVQAPGRLEPVKEVEISSQVVARIERMPVEEGDRVKAGDLLCELDDDDFRAQVESGEARVAKLRAAIRRAQAELEKCQRDDERQKRLAANDATSKLEILNYRTALIGAEAALEVAKQELVEAEALLQSAKEKLQETTIVSPIDGVVASLQAKEGEVVVTGTMNNPGTVIMVVCDLSKMQVRAYIDETDVALVRRDQPARIYLQSDSDTSFPGRVFRIAPKGTREQFRDVVRFETLIMVESTDPRIKPAMNANVEIEVKRRDDALTVPIEAVVYRRAADLPKELRERALRDAAGTTKEGVAARRKAQHVKVIFCMEGDRAVPKLVKTGISDRQDVVITEGLKPDDMVITGPYRSLDRLKDGRSVKLKEDHKPGQTEEPNDVASDAQPKPPPADSQSTSKAATTSTRPASSSAPATRKAGDT